MFEQNKHLHGKKGFPDRTPSRRLDFAVLDLTAGKYNFREFARNFDDFYRDEEERKTDPNNSQKKKES